QPDSIVEAPGIHPRFRNSRFATQLQKHLEQARKTAAIQNLSSQKQRRPKPTPAQQVRLRDAAGDRENVFAPIRQALEQQFGSHAAKFMLSNKMINSLLNGSILLQELPLYRQELMREIAAAAGIALDRYGNEPKMDG
ncbi:MAG TPA: hypothetical protein VFL47_11085, partial [Flavisolibacter sp.]|nr:hypothetical protein [Flavisolibacter sp.]